MTEFPIRPHLKSYRGAIPKKQAETVAQNRAAQRVADHLNHLVANDPKEIQVYFFENIALDLKLTVDLVRSAISSGGYNGITLGVSAADRARLEQYRRDS